MRRLYSYLNSIFIVLISMSMTISTLHSHHNIQWNSAQNHANTSHNITVDSAQCPVCGYLFNADPSPVVFFKQVLAESSLVQVPGSLTFLPSSFSPVLGRSPPASG
ncbi:MAG: hypothetical protein ACNS64_03940 [Candidatus Halalkalibacterium sp. M3_1C_030]